VDLALQVAGIVVALAGTFVVAAYGAFLTPLRMGTVLIPVSVLIGVGGIWALSTFVSAVTEIRWLALLPGVGWLVLTFLAAIRTTEGDLILTGNNWVATVYLLSGTATVGFCGYRLLLPRRR
jgi:hypothetical protein